MADKDQKEPTPPPLLLMPAGGGLTLNPSDQQSVLLPVVQSEPSLLDDGEVDSFVGQELPAETAAHGEGAPTGAKKSEPASSGTYFKGSSLGTSDPFAQIGHIPPPQPLPPSFSLSQPSLSNPAHTLTGLSSTLTQAQAEFTSPSDLSSAASSGINPAHPTFASAEAGSTNIYRQKGLMRHAQPPSGAYPGLSGPSAGPSSFNTFPSVPSGYSPAPFLTPAASDSSQDMSHFPGTTGQPPGPYSLGSQRMMVPGMGVYQPVQHHWCYQKLIEGHEVWYTFSRLDSKRLEEQFLKESSGGSAAVISTDGGRYDVDIGARTRRAVYWEEDPNSIQRCSWFYKRERDNRYVPYNEEQAEFLEAEYKRAVENNDWHKRIELPRKDSVVMHNPNVMVHFQASSQPDEWGNVQTDQRPRVVKRGVDEFGTTEDGESAEVDHLVFVLHGIGEAREVQFRNIVECVDDFRSVSNELLKSHFGPYINSRHIHRVEFLPVSWHSVIHSEASGIDNRLKTVTLPSTHKLRDFVNNTLMDILLYSSPAVCQNISDTVCGEMNRLFQLFLARNPTFSGDVSIAGHGLGAAISFDILMNQQGVDEPVSNRNVNSQVVEDRVTSSSESVQQKTKAATPEPELTLESLLEKVGLKDKMQVFQQEQMDLDSLEMCSEQDLKDLGLPMGPRKKLQLVLQEKKEAKKRKLREELKEEVRRELEQKLKPEGKQSQNCSSANSEGSMLVKYIMGQAGAGQPSVTYTQLEFSPSCLFALGSPVGMFLSARGVQHIGENFKLPTCHHFLNIFHPFDPVAYRLEPLIQSSSSTLKPVLIPHHKGRKRLHLELKDGLTRMGMELKQKIIDSLRSTWHTLHEFALAHRTESSGVDSSQGFEKEMNQHVDSMMAHFSQQQDDKSDTASVCSLQDEDIPMGQLNDGRRVDYVLQEKPIESFNDYLFSLASHVCYWTSEDTVLLMLKEIYAPLGISPIMPGPDGRTLQPVMPRALGPPPKSGFTPSDHSVQQFPPQAGSPHVPPPPRPPLGPTFQAPPLNVSRPVSHIQGPLTRVSTPFVPGRSPSQGSSRSSTPPVGGQGVA